MTELSCTYGNARDEAIVAYLYDEADDNPAQRALFDTHLQTCARCRADVASLRVVRKRLSHWSPPEPINLPTTIGNLQRAWWRDFPAWAQVAAALLFLGVSAGIANLDVRYDRNGLSVRTGWSRTAGGAGGSDRAGAADVALVRPAAASSAAPWKADIAALESQLKNEIRAAQTSSSASPAAAVRNVTAGATDAEITRRVRALVEESEKRQQRELALRIAELVRDVNAQRQADLVRIDRTLGVVQNNVGIEVMKTRNQMDLIYRASQRQ